VTEAAIARLGPSVDAASVVQFRSRAEGDHQPPASPIPPLLQRLLDAQSSVGLPPAYLPKNEDEGEAS
jgi:hypothetical protein